MTQDMTQISEPDAEEFTQSLGQIVGGTWRQIALADRLGVPAALGLSTREWVDQRLGGYVRLSISDRREAIAELTSNGMPTRKIGDVLGVNHATVVRDRGANAPPEPEPEPEPQVRAPDEPTAGASAPPVQTWTEPEPEPAWLEESESEPEPVPAIDPAVVAERRKAQIERERQERWTRSFASVLTSIPALFGSKPDGKPDGKPDDSKPDGEMLRKSWLPEWGHLVPGMDEHLTPDGIRVSADRLRRIADYLEQEEIAL